MSTPFGVDTNTLFGLPGGDGVAGRLQVNYDGNDPYADGKKGLCRERTVPVRSLPPNQWGLYEMHGNVWEWCADWFGDYPQDPQIDPSGPSEGDHRVLRGGSWINYRLFCRAASRDGDRPDGRSDLAGFRIALGQRLDPAGQDTSLPAAWPAGGISRAENDCAVHEQGKVPS